jgi:hypothetical protein
MLFETLSSIDEANLVLEAYLRRKQVRLIFPPSLP